MKKLLLTTALILAGTTALSQSLENDPDGFYDSTSYVNTDSTTTNTTNSNITTDNTNTNDTTINSTSTATNTNTNTNNTTITSDNTNTNNNTNTNTSTVTSTATNTNNNTNTNTNTNNTTINSTTSNTNTNNNTNNTTVNQTTDSTINQTVNSTSNVTSNNTNTNINTSTSTNTNTNTNDTTINSTATNTNNNTNVNDSTINQKVESPPASAIAPTMMPSGDDTCTVSYSAAVQTQIIGMSGGGHVRDLNCERLKNAKTLYNMGMKVAAVALMCQEKSVYDAMEMAGTPCPFRGSIGAEAQALWDNDPERQPKPQKEQPNDAPNLMVIGGIVLLLLTGI